MSEKITQKLRISYFLALFLLGLAVVFNYIILSNELNQQHQDAYLINIAGRQRMFSQAISKQALILQQTEDPEKFKVEQKILEENLNRWEEAFKFLLEEQGQKKTKLNDKTIYAELVIPYNEILASAQKLVKVSHKEDFSILIGLILKNEGPFLSIMDAIVNQYEQDAKAKLERTKKVNLILLLVFLLLILIEGIVIFARTIKWVTIFSHKINDQKQALEKTNQELKTVEEFLLTTNKVAGIGGWSYDLRTKKVEWTNGIYDLLELPLSYEPTFEKTLEFYTKESRQRLEIALQKTIREQVSTNIELEVETAQKTQIWIRVIAKAIVKEKGDIVLFGTSQNISEQRERERALQEAKENAELAAKVKADFLANMSHEIRTPLNAIIGFSEILRQTPLELNQQEYLQNIQNSGNHLLSIVNDILDFSRVDAGDVVLNNYPFFSKKLFAELKAVSLSAAQQKGLDLQFFIDSRLPEILVGDLLRVKQVLLNLLNNAIKFTPKGKVELFTNVVQSADEDQLWVEFRVKDTGIGIAKEKQELIFNRFKQANEGVNREYGGTGLGLAISKQLVEVMGGSIQLESELGKGTEFKLVIAFQKDTQGVKPERIKKTRRILILENQEMTRFMISAYLKETSVDLLFVETQEDAIKLLKQEKLDSILINLKMDALEITKIIRKNLNLTLPIIVLSTNPNSNEEAECLNAGITAYLPKPFRKTELFEKLQLS